MLPTSAADFYDGPAGDHHLIHADRDASVRSQGSAPHAPVGREGSAVLDRACGIGTQALGPAPHGHRVTGTDLSPRAAARAARGPGPGPEARTAAAGMRHLPFADGRFDVVVRADNSLRTPGFTAPAWRAPDETGFFQPLLLARAPS
ncbi:methyltransferase domain-containing protein [Streptomyces hydrogenans]